MEEGRRFSAQALHVGQETHRRVADDPRGCGLLKTLVAIVANLLLVFFLSCCTGA